MAIRRKSFVIILSLISGQLFSNWENADYLDFGTSKNPSSDLLTAWQNSLQTLEDDTTSTDDDADDPHVTTIISDPDGDFGDPVVNDDVFVPNDTVISSRNIDTDDDVPMLTNIYNRLNELDQDNDHQNLTNIWNRQADIAGQIQEYNSTEVRMTQFADLENSLRRLEIQMRDSRGQYLDENGSPTGEYGSLVDVVNAINNQAENNATGAFDLSAQGDSQRDDLNQRFQAMSDDIKRTPSNSLEQSGILSATLDFNFLGKDYYFAPLDPGGLGNQNIPLLSKLPSRDQLFLFIKRAILIAILAIYYISNFKLLFLTTETLIKANESNTVSNYSIFGINLGGTALKTIKIGIWTAFLATTAFTTIVGLHDAQIDFTFEEGIGVTTDQGVIDTLISTLMASLASIADWAQASVNLFLGIVPVLTIISALTTFYANKTFILGAMLATNRAQRIAS